MALALDAASSLDVAAAGGSATFTWSHTCTGSQLVLLVAAGLRQTSGPAVTGVTYNGVALTAVSGTAVSDGSRNLSWWYLIAPATGAHNVVVTYASNVTAARRFAGTAASWTGAHQTTPVSGGTTTTGQLNATTLTVTSATNSVVLAACIVGPTDPATNPLSPGSGQTALAAFNTGISGTNDLRGATSYEAGAASVASTWTSGSTTTGVYAGCSLAPAAGAEIVASAAVVTAGSAALSAVTQSFAPSGDLVLTGSVALRVAGVLAAELSGAITTSGAATLTVTRALEAEGAITFRGSAYLSIPVTPVSAGRPTYRVENSLNRQIGNATWYDVLTERLQSATITRGRPDELSGTTAGHLDLVLDNDDGELDLSNPAATLAGWFDGAYLVRVIATAGGTDYILGTAYVEALEHQRRGAFGADKIVKCVDAFKELGQTRPTAYDFLTSGQEPGLFPSSSIGGRIDDLLDAVPFAVLGERDLAGGSYFVREERVGSTPFLQLIDWMLKLERVGIFFVAANGDVTFRDQGARTNQPSRGTFGIGAGAIPVASYTVTETHAGIYNEVHVHRVTYSDTDQVAFDGNSILRYGKSVYTLDPKAADQLDSDVDALRWAQDMLTTYATPRYRIDSVTIDPYVGDLEDEAWWHVLDTEVGDRITLALPLAGSSGVVSEDYHVEALEHRMQFKGLQHTVTWRVSKRAGTVGFV